MSIGLLQKLGFFMNILLIGFIITPQQVNAQNTAGNAVFNFLTLPYSAKASALGGINISSMGKDLGLAMYNPSLLNPNMDDQLHVSIKPFFAGIQQYDVTGVNYWERKNIVLGWGVHYLDYGNITMTDLAGNELGAIHPNDYAIQFAASTNYIQNFQIGTTVKWIQSNYGMYQSSGLAMDIGLTYLAPNHLSQASILVNNLGTQFNHVGSKQELPFNLILGWSKKLEYAPIQFSITANRLSVWNNLYYDSAYANVQGDAAPGKLQNLFNHLILASELYLGNQVDINLGYNFIKRYELNVQNQANGLNGFSTGLGLRWDRMYVQYGTAFFQQNSYHHFSITYQIKK